MHDLKLTAVICTHNPRKDYLERTLKSLQNQSLPSHEWELLIIDNNSEKPLSEWLDLSWQPNARILVETELGLTPARLCGYAQAKAPLLVYIDDDNVLKPDYFSEALRIMKKEEKFGAIGGKSLPEFETTPEPWFPEAGVDLACRDMGDKMIVGSWRKEKIDYPACSPIGAGMVIRKAVMESYVKAVKNDPRRRALDRTGKSLISGGDNDMIMTVLEDQWDVAYCPELSLTHLIPSFRVDPSYLARLARESYRSWIIVLDLHGLRPWTKIQPILLPAYKLKYQLRYKPWKGMLETIHYSSAVGQSEGRALLAK